MARIAHVVAAGVPHHVTQRGNRSLETFFHDKDYKAYIALMAEWCRQCGVEIWAFWEDRYQATAIASDQHFARCLTYIDLNMVRAGVVEDPVDWPESGYAELSQTKQRYHLLDYQVLEELLGMTSRSEMQSTSRGWVEEAMRQNLLERDSCWSRSLAVGDEEFVAGVKTRLGIKGWNRTETKEGQGFVLRGKRGRLRHFGPSEPERPGH